MAKGDSIEMDDVVYGGGVGTGGGYDVRTGKEEDESPEVVLHSQTIHGRGSARSLVRTSVSGVEV